MGKISIGTIIRTIVLALALINQLLVATGHAIIEIDNETITQLITTGFTVIASVVAWWKNNSFTKAAINGDVAMHNSQDIEVG